jgi:tryptophanase
LDTSGRRPPGGPVDIGAGEHFRIHSVEPIRTTTIGERERALEVAVIEVVRFVAGRASELRGLRISAAPAALRHFSARFEPLA